LDGAVGWAKSSTLLLLDTTTALLLSHYKQGRSLIVLDSLSAGGVQKCVVIRGLMGFARVVRKALSRVSSQVVYNHLLARQPVLHTAAGSHKTRAI
jgi:hypothetical protein